MFREMFSTTDTSCEVREMQSNKQKEFESQQQQTSMHTTEGLSNRVVPPYRMRRRRTFPVSSTSPPRGAKQGHTCLLQVSTLRTIETERSQEPERSQLDVSHSPEIPTKKMQRIAQSTHLPQEESVSVVQMDDASRNTSEVSGGAKAGESPLELWCQDHATESRTQAQGAPAQVSPDRIEEQRSASHSPLPAIRSDTAPMLPLPQDSDLGEALPSRLLLEQSLLEEPLPLTPLSMSEEDDVDGEEDEEELPSFLERRPKPITEGLCVWCKFRKYPFWPAVVKSVNRRNKKASIVFIDTHLFDDKTIPRGLSVSLKTLKPFDCEEAEELAEQAKQQYHDAITWCLELIYDYKIRIGGGSFSGSFLEYCGSDISHPIRMQSSQDPSHLNFPTQLIEVEEKDSCESSEENGTDSSEPGVKILPDRSRAARCRANQRLVEFIVKKHGAEQRLLSVLSGQEPSRWLQEHLKASRQVVDPYLEDEEHVDQVYLYLEELLRRSPSTMPCLANLERIPLVLDVLLPEALICAIAGVDNVPLEEAEKKYMKGPSISKREKQEFDMRIERLMRF